MFYAEIERPIYLGRKQDLYYEINKRYGVEHGVHLVRDGFVQGEKGQARFWDYKDLFKILPSYRGRMVSNEVVKNEDGKNIVVIDLFLQNGLLLECSMSVELVEKNHLCQEDDGGYLLLCRDKGNYFQIIVSENETHI